MSHPREGYEMAWTHASGTLGSCSMVDNFRAVFDDCAFDRSNPPRVLNVIVFITDDEPPPFEAPDYYIPKEDA